MLSYDVLEFSLQSPEQKDVAGVKAVLAMIVIVALCLVCTAIKPAKAEMCNGQVFNGPCPVFNSVPSSFPSGPGANFGGGSGFYDGYGRPSVGDAIDAAVAQAAYGALSGVGTGVAAAGQMVGVRIAQGAARALFPNPNQAGPAPVQVPGGECVNVDGNTYCRPTGNATLPSDRPTARSLTWASYD